MVATTFQSVTDKDQQKLLRRIVRRNDDEQWSVSASDSTDWKLQFTRKIEAKNAGDVDQHVNVSTDIEVSMPKKTGSIKSFHDSKEVFLPSPRRIWASYSTCKTIAKLAADGWRFSLQSSGGSTNTSHLDLAFCSFVATKDYCEVTIGQSIYHMGKLVLSDVVD